MDKNKNALVIWKWKLDALKCDTYHFSLGSHSGEPITSAPNNLIVVIAEESLANSTRRNGQHVSLLEQTHAAIDRAGRDLERLEERAESGHFE